MTASGAAPGKRAWASRIVRRLILALLVTALPHSALADPPVAVPDTFAVQEGGSTSGNVLTNDSDIDDDPFVAELATGPSHHVGGFTLGANGAFSYQHDGDESSSDSFTYTAYDEANDERSPPVTVTINVGAVNDQPVITGQSALTTPEETALTITAGDVTVNDPDGPGATLKVGTGSNYSLSGNTVTPANNFNGTLTVPVTVDDGSGAGNSESAVFNLSVTVTAVNTQPVITGQGALSTDEETALNITVGDLTINDPDGPGAVLDVGTGANYSVSGNTITPANNFNGTLTVPVTVDDQSGETNSESDVFNLSVTVDPVNDQPVITSQSPLATEEETPLTIRVSDLTIVDPDDSSFTLDVRNGTNYSVSGNTITPADNFDGTLTVPVTVDDGSGAGNSESAVFNLTVVVGAANDRPVITGQVALETDEETPLTIRVGDLTVNDPDGPGAVLDVRNGTNYTVSGNQITPAQDFTGALTVPVTVDDQSGEPNSESAVFSLQVTVNPVNDRPVITAQDPLSTAEEQALTIRVGDLTIVDPDSNSFTLDVRNGANYSLSGNTITPADNFSGSLTVPVTVDDRSGAGNSESAVFNLTVDVGAANDRPVITGQRALSTDEDTALTLSTSDLTIDDPDGPGATLDVRNGPNYSVSGTTITPDEDFSGTLSVPVTVDDESGENNSTSPVFNVTVAVDPVNDRPSITGQDPLSTQEETALTIRLADLTIEDPDSNSFTLDVRDGANYSVSGNTITPDDNFDGSLTVPVTVDDGSGAGNSTSAVFNLAVSVGAANDRPVITGQNPLSTDEETPLTIRVADLVIDDPDGPGASLDVRNGQNYTVSGDTITPAEDFDGILTVPVTVDDESGAANSESAVFNLTVTVDPVNDRPRITDQLPLSTPEDSPLTLRVSDVTIVDPDGPGATLEVLGGANYTVDGRTITPTDEFSGTLTVPVTIDDGSGAANAVSQPFNLAVEVSAENDPPRIVSPIGDRTTSEDQSFSLDVSGNFTDPDGDELTFSATGLPDSGNFDMSPDGVLSGTGDDEDVGSWNVTVRARDPSDAGASQNFSFSVINVNDRPVITGQEPLSTDEETPLTIGLSDLTIEDPDSSSFTLLIRDGTGYTVAGTTITPDDDFAGTLSVPVTVDDGSGAANATSPIFNLAVTVTPSNDRPVITGQQPVTMDEDESRTIQPSDLVVSDPDNDFPADFSVIVQNGANYTRSDTTITPDANYNGPLTVPVRVDDGSGEPNARSEVFNLSVTVESVNDAPQVTSPIGNQSTREDESFSLNVAGNFSDVEGDELTFTATGQPGSIVLSSAGRFSGTPTDEDVGNYTVIVRATDPSQDSATAQFRLTIVNVNDRPVIVGQGTLITPEETPLEITLADLVVTDPDNDYPGSFSLKVERGANYTRRGSTITPDEEFAGVLAVPVTVDDGSGANNSESETFVLSVSVTSENDVPVITGQQPAPLIVDEDEPLTIGLDNLLVTDPDDVYPDDFTLNIEPGDNYTATAADTITPAEDFTGLLVVNVTVTDPEATSPQFGLIVDVQPINDAPVITGQRTLRTDEETPITVTIADLIIDDPDVPAQTQTLTLRPGENYTLDNDTVTPAENFVGSLSVRATVNDGEVDSEPFNLVITVGAVNDAPVITGQLPLSTPEDAPLTITLGDLTVDDPDNDYPTDFTLAVLSGDNYSVDGATITPAADFVGSLTVPVTVNDGSADSEPFALDVLVEGVNDRPVITGQVPLATDEDTPISVSLTDLRVTDPDNVYPDDFTLALSPGENYTVAGTTVTPLSNFNGRLDVPTTVNDGAQDSAPFMLRIRVDGANDAPTLIAPIPDQQAVEDEFFRLDLSQNFDDADGDTLTYEIEGLPDTDNLTLNPTTGVLSGTPDFNDTRDFPYDIVVTAKDESDASGSGSFQLTIAALDRANVALSVAATPSPSLLRDQIRWTLTVNNAGPGESFNLGVDGEFTGTDLTVTPSGASDCAVSPAAGGVTSFSCDMPEIAAGAQAMVMFDVSTTETGDIMLAAEAGVQGSLPIDPNTNDNRDQKSTSVARELSNGALQALGDSSVLAIASGDVDGDGDPDLIFGTGAGEAAEIYLGTGFRKFETEPLLVPENSPTEGIAVADLDEDGDQDLVFANGAGLPDTIYFNDGSGGFLPQAALGNRDSRGVVVADFNGDGSADVAFAAIAGNPIYFSDGAGGYVLVNELGNSASLGVATADFNGDGWPDLVFANSEAPSRLYLNDGGTGFLPPVRFNIGNATSVAVIRADGNGSPDLVFGRVPDEFGDLPANPVLTNDGAGSFTLTESLGGAPTLDVLVGDVNSDGRDDLIFVNSTGTHQVWRGTASGFRLNAEQIVAEGAIEGVAGDLGNDGGVDLALAEVPQSGGDLFLNDSFGKLGLGDAIPPTLELLGARSVDIEAGSTFDDPGAAAMDDIDGDISDQVLVDNPIENRVVGTYTVTYRVADFAGNQAEPVTRSVRVTPAAGSGGGGGGAAGPIELLLLAFVFIAAGRRQRRTGTLAGTAQGRP